MSEAAYKGMPMLALGAVFELHGYTVTNAETEMRDALGCVKACPKQKPKGGGDAEDESELGDANTCLHTTTRRL